MESIIRNVKDLQGDERHVYESVLGERLRENQQVFIMVLDPGVLPDERTRREAVEDIHRIAAKAAENMERSGVSPEEADAVVDEAMEHVRYGKS